MSRDSVGRLSEVLGRLQGLKGEDVSRQLEMMRREQQEMRTQLSLHEAQIAALQEVIVLLRRDAQG